MTKVEPLIEAAVLSGSEKIFYLAAIKRDAAQKKGSWGMYGPELSKQVVVFPITCRNNCIYMNAVIVGSREVVLETKGP